jgi:hypothetical protein
MTAYDGDSAFQLVTFRESLRVVPEPLVGSSSPDQRHERTAVLWAGLRRVYFGENEREQVNQEQPPLSHDQIM